MSNRCGDIDPFIIPYIMDREGYDLAAIRDILSTDGGLAGISGVSGDVRDLEDAAAQGNDRARLALDVFAYSVKKYIGAYAAALGGLDALVFTGGIGENGSDMRARICRGLGFLGIHLDPERNKVCGKEAVISEEGPISVLVVPTNEEIIVAREVVQLLRSSYKK
jgi:acetate kinase